MHLVDTTLFYSPTSGGVRRYLNAKHSWYARQTPWRHTLLVPGAATAIQPGDTSTLSGAIVPGTFNYRLPLQPRRWAQLLDELQPDIIEAGDAFHPAWAALRVAAQRGIPAVAFFHSHLPRLVGKRCGSGVGQLAGRYLSWLYERFDMVCAPSRVMCDYLRSLGLTRVVLQPLGVDVDVFHPAQRCQTLRRELGLRDDVRLLAYAGRFSAEKNIDVLHTAFARLGPGYHLLLIGGAERQRPAANITAIPYRRDSAELAGLLASADALVHAGTAETFGLVVLEAMACGRPVVGVCAGAIGELIDNRTGSTAARADGRLFAQAIRDLYDRDIEALGQAARARVLERFSWDRALQHQQMFYAALSEKKRIFPEGWATASRVPSGDQQVLPAGPSSR
ncbi:MAG: glycosyltransferase [Steroidobacteraceae bacterium]